MKPLTSRFKNSVKFQASKPMSLNDPFVTLTQNEKQLLEILIKDEDVLQTFHITIKNLGLRICFEYTGFILAYYFRGEIN